MTGILKNHATFLMIFIVFAKYEKMSHCIHNPLEMTQNQNVLEM